MAFKKVHSLTVLVDNNFGVLARVAALIRREGCNIKSMTVMQTENVMVSRLLLSVECRSLNLEHIAKKLDVLGVVEQVPSEELSGFVCRELVLIQLSQPAGEQEKKLLEEAGATAVEENGLTFQLTASPEKIDRLTDALSDCCSYKLVRSGALALELQK